ncbi:hypothetical protein [Neolewinella litorea]|uniref:Outer membrane protein beta-barrel domain-containing protein n=1 Tax=Neolewinella litorea TaxID=2562452 RepID=A0A4S4NQG7_9BACT|nr:hypothetical protein [Neolewinella litorea]THH40588.1 hypothetical protein E4021_07605 [Neolewinella litorea]
MRTNLLRSSCLMVVSLASTFLCSALWAQQRLDVGVHLSPHVLTIHSETKTPVREGGLSYTEGENGVELGWAAGGYLEYEVVSGLFLRAGVDVSRKRYRYAVNARREDPSLDESGTNRVVYMAIELPVSVIYRFDYLPNNDRFLVGVGGVANRWVGDPQLETAFYRGSSNRPPLDYNRHSFTVFGGFERFLSSRFVMGIEPFVSYSPWPTEFRLETRTDAVAGLEAGVALRLRFDN